MPVKDESKFLHVRLKPKASRVLKKIANFTRRSLNEEANIAVENHSITFHALDDKPQK